MFERRDEAISELLKNQGLVGLQQLEDLKQSAHTAGQSLADGVIESGWAEREALLEAVAAHLAQEWVRDIPDELSPAMVGLLPARLARERGIVPWRETEGVLAVLAIDPFDPHLAADLVFAAGREIRVKVGDPARIEALIRRHYADTPSRDIVHDGDGPAKAETAAEPTAADLETMAGQAPVIRWVNTVLARAIRDRASDVHFEPFERECKVRVRIDGVLYEMPPPPPALALPIASRLKVLASLDIAERRRPQDGRLRVNVAGRKVDLRVSTLPTQFGESVVLRILDASAVQLELGQLGMTPEVQRGVETVIRRPHGIFVITGPTSSGKTTTLYSGLRAINTPDLKLLTAEDPVEYEVDGIVQVPVNLAAGLTFAAAMRSFLRQDPDVIMIGEIRDEETARIAVQAALTGHLVLSTLHTNDAPGAVARLLDLGVEPFLVASTVEAVLAQRLVRRICPGCRTEHALPAALLDRAGLTTAEGESRRFFHGAGCPQCAQTGYRGRTGIYEWLPMTETLREKVTLDEPTRALRECAQAGGMRTLREDGLRAVFAGETTLEEILQHT